MIHSLIAVFCVINAFSLCFTQQKQMADFDSIQVSTGKLTYNPPDYIRWEYITPQPMAWEINGKETQLNRPLKKLLTLIRQSVVADFDAMKKEFAITQKDNRTQLTPLRSEMKNLYQHIIIEKDSRTGLAKKVELKETNGDITTISFYNVQQQ